MLLLFDCPDGFLDETGGAFPFEVRDSTVDLEPFKDEYNDMKLNLFFRRSFYYLYQKKRLIY